MFFISFVTDGPLTRQKYITEDPMYANSDIDLNSMLMRLSATSIFSCALFCASHPECVSFTYSKIYGLCCGTRFQTPMASSLISSPGFKFYKFLPGELLVLNIPGGVAIYLN